MSFFSCLLCNFLELCTLITGTCSPADNVLTTSVLLLSYLVIVNFHLKLVENPKAAQSVFMCKSVPQKHSKVWEYWEQLAMSGEGSWYTLYAEKITLPWKLTKSVCKCATCIRSVKLLRRYKLCCPQERRESSTALVFMREVFMDINLKFHMYFQKCYK